MTRDQENVKRFVREAKMATALSDPHIVQVLEAGHDTELGRPFLLMPLLLGTDCSRLVAKLGPIEPMTAVRIIVQACAGLDYLHKSGIIHRDVKPSNLFLEQRPNGEVIVRICDFGIAKQMEADAEQLTTTGIVVGSTHYVAPEQIHDSRLVDERSDVWGLGVSLYRLLSNKVPFGDLKGAAEVFVKITTTDAPSIQNVAPWVEPGLALTLHRALRRDPMQRWPSVAAFADGLRAFMGGEMRITTTTLAPLSAELRSRVAVKADLSLLAGNDELSLSRTATNDSSSSGLFNRLQQQPGGLDQLIGQTLAGRYKVLRLLGRGGMGAVFEVSDQDGTPLAAKLIDRRHLGEEEATVKRFIREAKAATSIDSEHVVRTHEASQDDELKVPFIVMELMRGVDLRSLLQQKGALDQTAVVRIFVQAAKGIAAAHHRGIVHRDIKPANLFLHKQADGKITVKVCDFGVAKRASDSDTEPEGTGSHELTRTGGMIGSPMYMSPEQAMNAKNVDHRTDIWSLCISLYEALSGTKVWAGRSSLGQIIVAICTQQVPPLRRVAPWVNKELAEVVHRGLRSEIGQRWPTIDELIAALEPYASGTDVVREADLKSISNELRATEPSTPPPPLHDQEVSTLGGLPGVPTSSTLRTVSASDADFVMKKRGRGGLVAIGLAAIAAAAATGVVVRQQSTPVPPQVAVAAAPAPPAPSPTPTPAATPEPRLVKAVVKIEPADARVTVNGNPAMATDGAVTLEGQPGAAFQVALFHDGEETAVSVVVSSDGAAVPAVVSLPKKAEARSRRAQRVPARRAAPTAPAPESAAEPAKPAEKPAQPSFKNEW
jgi:serine/threonine protein kinase